MKPWPAVIPVTYGLSFETSVVVSVAARMGSLREPIASFSTTRTTQGKRSFGFETEPWIDVVPPIRALRPMKANNAGPAAYPSTPVGHTTFSW